MKFDPLKFHRRSIRLKGYDYSQTGAYFVTICTHNRECLFGEILDGEMQLNDLGRIITEEWSRSPQIRKEIELPEWVVMPNHLHGIVVIKDGVGADGLVGTHGSAPSADDSVGATDGSPLPQTEPIQPHGPTKHSLGSFIAGFRSSATKRINIQREMQGAPVCQRNYGACPERSRRKHIVRNEREWNAIAEYIRNNPLRWSLDLDNPMGFSHRAQPECAEDYWIDVGLDQ